MFWCHMEVQCVLVYTFVSKVGPDPATDKHSDGLRKEAGDIKPERSSAAAGTETKEL